MVIIPAGSAILDITLDPLNDPDVEPGADTVTVTVQPSGDYTVGSPASATITIADNETFTNTSPFLYAATASASSSITVHWTDNFEMEGKYRVQRAPAGTSSWTTADVVANSTSHTFTGLAAGQTYDFQNSRILASRAAI
jgi:hypothetical protein